MLVKHGARAIAKKAVSISAFLLFQEQFRLQPRPNTFECRDGTVLLYSSPLAPLNLIAARRMHGERLFDIPILDIYVLSQVMSQAMYH
jgi:hypothetical protein